jgi:hypothetical protein
MNWIGQFKQQPSLTDVDESDIEQDLFVVLRSDGGRLRRECDFIHRRIRRFFSLALQFSSLRLHRQTRHHPILIT